MSTKVTVPLTRMNECLDALGEAKNFARALEAMASSRFAMPDDIAEAIGQIVLELEARIGTTIEAMSAMVEEGGQ